MADTSRPFRHRPPSFRRQLSLGVYVYGVLAPTVWALERLGLARRAVSSVISRHRRAIEAADPLRTYVPGPQDVFVSTVMKSGTNWLIQIAYQLIHRGEGDFEHVHDVVPWPETKGMPRFLRDYAVPLEDEEVWKRAPERMRVIKTHGSLDQLPISEAARYLTVIRDPKDVFVSSYLFARDGFLGPAMPSIDTWLELFLDGKAPGGSWAHHAAQSWWRHRWPHVRVFSFKAMKKDLPGTVREVAAFLGIAASEDVVQKVCERSSFAHMKENDAKFAIGKLIPWKSAGAMIRRGALGGSAELLSLARRREIDERCQAELIKYSSDLPYERFADRA